MIYMFVPKIHTIYMYTNLHCLIILYIISQINIIQNLRFGTSVVKNYIIFLDTVLVNILCLQYSTIAVFLMPMPKNVQLCTVYILQFIQQENLMALGKCFWKMTEILSSRCSQDISYITASYIQINIIQNDQV